MPPGHRSILHPNVIRHLPRRIEQPSHSLPMIAVTAWKATVHAPPSLRVLKTDRQHTAPFRYAIPADDHKIEFKLTLSASEDLLISYAINYLQVRVKRTWNPIRRMLFANNIKAVSSKAIRGTRGKRSAAMSQISRASGCLMQYCQRIYEVSDGQLPLQQDTR